MSTPSGRLMAMGTLFICAPVYEAFDPTRQLRQWEIHLRENFGASKQKVIALWSGPAAESFMRMHRPACKPGQPLELTFERIFPLHNELHGITPRSIVKQVRDLIDGVYSEKASKEQEKQELQRAMVEDMSEKDVAREIKRLEKLMLEHARNLEFEKAARVRDQLALLKEQAFGAHGQDNVVPLGGKAA